MRLVKTSVKIKKYLDVEFYSNKIFFVTEDLINLID